MLEGLFKSYLNLKRAENIRFHHIFCAYLHLQKYSRSFKIYTHKNAVDACDVVVHTMNKLQHIVCKSFAPVHYSRNEPFKKKK